MNFLRFQEQAEFPPYTFLTWNSAFKRTTVEIQPLPENGKNSGFLDDKSKIFVEFSTFSEKTDIFIQKRIGDNREKCFYQKSYVEMMD